MIAIRYLIYLLLIAFILWYVSLWLIPPVKRWWIEHVRKYEEWDDKLTSLEDDEEE